MFRETLEKSVNRSTLDILVLKKRIDRLERVLNLPKISDEDLLKEIYDEKLRELKEKLTKDVEKE